MIEAILAMQKAYYEETGRRLTMLACGPRMYSVLRAEAMKRFEDGNWVGRGVLPAYDDTLTLNGLTIVQSLGEGMVWA